MVAPAHILDGNAGLCFAQRADDLLFDKNASSRPIFLKWGIGLQTEVLLKIGGASSG